MSFFFLTISNCRVKYIHIVQSSPSFFSRNLFILQNWNSILIKQELSISLPTPAPGNRHSTFCLSDFDYSRYLVESYSICPFVTDLFHLA